MGEIRGPLGLYLHIPFCDAKCAYCDFVTFTDRSRQIDRYLAALSTELKSYGGGSLATLFIGGGTPTVLSVPQINFLFGSIRSVFDTSDLAEATVEANPESATPERLRAFRACGVNRISFGVQSSKNTLLAKLDRLHSWEKFLAVFADARAAGYDNINIDLIFGLPGQTLADWRETLDDVLRLSPEHVSAYALKIEPGTRFAKENVPIDGDLEADMYLAAAETLAAAGYDHYEISNFSKPGRASLHNLRYWENKITIGAGVSATSFVDGRRYKNTVKLPVYMEGWESGAPVFAEDARLDERENERESTMLALRLKAGVPESKIAPSAMEMATRFRSQGLAVSEKGMYSLTPKGWLLSNLLFQHFV